MVMRYSLVLAIKIGIIFMLTSIGNASDVEVPNTIKFGAVLSSEGAYREMLDAQKGYELWVTMTNQMKNYEEKIEVTQFGTEILIPDLDNPLPDGLLVTDSLGNRYFYKYQLTVEDDLSDFDEHYRKLVKLLDGDKVDFMMGSHPTFAFNETVVVNNRRRINYQCCVGPDPVYEQGLKYVFGVQTSNTKYSKQTIKSMAFGGAQRIAIAYRNDNVFTSTTCEAARDLVETELNGDGSTQVVMFQGYSGGTYGKDKEYLMETVVQQAIDADADVFVGCAFFDDGYIFVSGFNELQHRLKGMFMTVGPSQLGFVNNVISGEHGYGVSDCDNAQYLISAGQWHPAMKYSDDFYGNSDGFLLKFSEYVVDAVSLGGTREGEIVAEGYSPTYVTAGASAAGLSLNKAIQAAFAGCEIVDSDPQQLFYNPDAIVCEKGEPLGYDRVREALLETDMETVFGGIGFNEFQRNVKKEPATTQVLQASDADPTLEIKCVLPVDAAEAAFVFPVPTPPACASEHYVYNVSSCSSSSEKRSIRFSWLEPKPCEGGISLPPSVDINCDMVPFGSSTATLVIALVVVGVAVALVFTAFVVVNAKKPVIKFAQRQFCLLFCAGTALSCLSTLSFLGSNDDTSCMLRPWLFHLSLTTMFGSLFVKVWRVWRVFDNPAMKKVQVPNSTLYMLIARMLVGDVIILAVWSLWTPSQAVADVQYETGVGDVTHTECRSDNSTMPTAAFMYKGGIIAVGCFLSFKTRHVDGMFSEARPIFLAVYNIAFVGGLTMLLTQVMDVTASSRLTLQTLGTIWCAIVSLGSVFVPKFFMLGTVVATSSIRVNARPTRSKGTTEYTSEDNVTLKDEVAKSRAIVKTLQAEIEKLKSEATVCNRCAGAKEDEVADGGLREPEPIIKE